MIYNLHQIIKDKFSNLKFIKVYQKYIKGHEFE